MKRRDSFNELLKLSGSELSVRGREIAEELMKLRFRRSTGQTQQNNRFKDLKRSLAQIKTLQSASRNNLKKNQSSAAKA